MFRRAIPVGFLFLFSAANVGADQTLTAEAFALKEQGIRYGGAFVPPGETSAWPMDC